jgi:hypothetical protein
MAARTIVLASVNSDAQVVKASTCGLSPASMRLRSCAMVSGAM